MPKRQSVRAARNVDPVVAPPPAQARKARKPPARTDPPADPLQTDPIQTDVFFEAFRLARLHGELLGETRLRLGQALRHPRGRAMFHFVADAPCLFVIEAAQGGRQRIVAQPGDLLILPQGHAHRILADAVETGAQRGACAQLTSGVFEFEALSGASLVRALPEWLHVRTGGADGPSEDSPEQWLALSFAAMRKEARQPNIGSRIMIARLIDIVFIWAVRHWLAQAPTQQRGWIAALRDPLVARALALLHAQPAFDWTVEALAARLHQSRSALGQRFAERVGEPPMRYLAGWRMQLAADLLLRTDLRISQIAAQVGYGSEPAFSRGFRRVFGSAPSDYRKRLREPPLR
ncbi:helix-turn-helix transcriptional regulator [Lysobacter antibioticus]|uniref:helix-turn-helix transcriptional regulator n=1 Tax=Lysobacter antibioticus TaxID=84531 RepID=UPI00068CBC5D|nr:AraC family transcriptional regulator [Lysobacter antibioticus]